MSIYTASEVCDRYLSVTVILSKEFQIKLHTDCHIVYASSSGCQCSHVMSKSHVI